MKRAALILVAFVTLFGCGSPSEPSTPISSSVMSSTSSVPIAGAYTSVHQLAAGLTAAGMPCLAMNVSVGPKSENGSCSLSSSGGSIEARMTVWYSPQLAETGIDASTNHADVAGGISGDRYYYVTGPTWLISLDNSAVAAGQIAGNFGGEMVTVGD